VGLRVDIPMAFFHRGEEPQGGQRLRAARAGVTLKF
jgi:hypothetical protein